MEYYISDIESFIGGGNIEDKEYQIYDKINVQSKSNDKNVHEFDKTIYGGSVCDGSERFSSLAVPVIISVKTIPQYENRYSYPIYNQHSILSDDLHDKLWGMMQNLSDEPKPNFGKTMKIQLRFAKKPKTSKRKT
jgi:hypothetical protein